MLDDCGLPMEPITRSIVPQPDAEDTGREPTSRVWYYGGQIHSFGTLLRKLSEIAPDGFVPVYAIKTEKWVWISRNEFPEGTELR